MAEKTGAAGPKPETPEIRRKLVWRMGVAGVMIALLLGALALFDRLNAPDDEEDAAPTFTAPVPTAKQEVSQPVTTAPAAAEAPAESATTPATAAANTPEKAAVPEGSAAPLTPGMPVPEVPQRPQVAAQPALPAAAHGNAPARNVAAPAARAPAATTPAAAAPASAVAAAGNGTGKPQAASSAAAPPPAPASILPAPAVPRLLNGYALQAGVFADSRRAEELHALLTLNGIPSTIETRVQAGPFRNRAEAAAAREKMKSLGIDTVLLPPRRDARP